MTHFRLRWKKRGGHVHAFAIGEAAGTVAKAKALVGRDIDDAKAKEAADLREEGKS